MKNCGSLVHDEVASKEFMEFLKNLVSVSCLIFDTNVIFFCSNGHFVILTVQHAPLVLMEIYKHIFIHTAILEVFFFFFKIQTIIFVNHR
jgi:hypothetical protein